MTLPRYRNQGHKIAVGWDNVAGLTNWTAITAPDGNPFLPPFDRDGFTDGVPRNTNSTLVKMVGIPKTLLKFPWISYSQLNYLINTFDKQSVTVAVHKPNSVNAEDVYVYNATVDVDLNQTVSLSSKQGGYENFIVTLWLVEEL